jgi:hypothetical protein
VGNLFFGWVNPVVIRIVRKRLLDRGYRSVDILRLHKANFQILHRCSLARESSGPETAAIAPIQLVTEISRRHKASSEICSRRLLPAVPRCVLDFRICSRRKHEGLALATTMLRPRDSPWYSALSLALCVHNAGFDRPFDPLSFHAAGLHLCKIRALDPCFRACAIPARELFVGGPRNNQ